MLREAGLVDCERRGTWVYYWVLPAALAQLSSLLQTTAPGSTSASGSPAVMSGAGAGAAG